MRLCYIANIRLPTEKAHGIQIMKMCEAFAEQGMTVDLLVPRRFNDLKGEPFDFYKVENNFRIIRIPCLDAVSFDRMKIGFLISAISFLIFTKIYLLVNKYDILYTREQMTGLFFNRLILELHTLPKKISWFYNYLFRRAKLIIVLTNFTKAKLLELEVKENKILVAPDAVDIGQFDVNISKEEARRKLDLPLDKKIILYTGSFLLYGWKGIGSLIEAAKFLNEDFLFVLVGGHQWEMQKLGGSALPQNVSLVPYQKYGIIPYYLKAADVLVIPNEKGNETSERYTSPLKLFEYMASQRPIASSNLPSLREILTDTEALFFEAGNAKDLARAIEEISQNNELADKLSYNAYLKVSEYTWDKRVKRIIGAIS